MKDSTARLCADGREARPWHALPAREVMDALGTGAEGLSEDEAARRLEQYGANRLRPTQRRSALMRFLLQFHNVLIYVLLAAAVITALLEHWVDMAVILGVVVINAFIGFVQEGRAERALEEIRNMLSLAASVMRGGKRMTIPAERLVPGDVVLLQSGDKVPADLRLVQVKNLQAQEAALTGESLPVEKSSEPVPESASLGDRASMAYSGTLITYGQGVGVVVATGEATEIGRISTLLAAVETGSTPLLDKLAHFGRWLSFVIILASGALFGFGVSLRDYPVSDMFLAAVGFAVAAIPEGLPAVLTITLAIGVERMARRNAIIRRLPAVETLGSVSVICSDKTGTLTRNEMTVQAIAADGKLFTVTGAGYEPEGEILLQGRQPPRSCRALLRQLMRGAVLCSDAALDREGGDWRVDGDPTEAALLVAAHKAGVDPGQELKAWPRIDVIPFESEHRFMATLHHNAAGEGVIYVKGAPEQLLQMCSRQRGGAGDEPLQEEYWDRRMEEMAARGQRVLALAFRPAPAGKNDLKPEDIDGDLILLGLFGMADPPRREAVEAVARCRSAGIEVKMITGDHATTACAVAAQLGLANPSAVLVGQDLDDLDGPEFASRIDQTTVFARTSPQHKLRIVEALQAAGEIVLMTGDGVNDAPALKRADVGVAMGIKGTEAAKEAAEMVLADDNFASIAHAVEEGRTVYDNIKKSILFILPTSGGEAFTLMAAIALGSALPITALQILWINMVTAVTLSLALAFEASEPDIMKRKPRRRDEPILSGLLVWRVIFVALLILAGTFGMFLWLRAQGAPIELARTAAVNTLVMFEAAYLLNARFLEASSFNRAGILGSRPALITIACVVLFQLLFTYAPPLQYLFHTAALDVAVWAEILAAAAIVFILVEGEKLLYWRLRRRK